MTTPELLAPAGNLKKLKYAIAFGADAVYLGAPDFSLRARINEFTPAKIKQAIKYAHARGVKVYITLNIFAHNKHLKKLPKHLEAISKLQKQSTINNLAYRQAGRQAGQQSAISSPDGIIISDPGILQIVKKYFPTTKLILSTQANVTNWQAAKFWYNQGVKRIILARELTLKEIAEIHKHVPRLELETFVHGAMCMSYSGRCLLSKLINNREANLGDCSHPCRWSYNIKTKKHPLGATRGLRKNIKTNEQVVLSECKHPNLELIVEQDKAGSYILNSRDLCLVRYLDKLKKAGVISFKIEGRTKSVYYLAIVTRAYRRVLNNLESPAIAMKELEKLQTRGYSQGFLFGPEKVTQNQARSHEKVAWQFAGEVTKNQSTNNHKSSSINQKSIFPHNTLKIGDKIEFIPPKGKVVSTTLKKMWDSNGQEIKQAHGGQKQNISIQSNITLPKFTLIRRKTQPRR